MIVDDFRQRGRGGYPLQYPQRKPRNVGRRRPPARYPHVIAQPFTRDELLGDVRGSPPRSKMRANAHFSDALSVIPRIAVGANEVLKKPLAARELFTSLARVLGT